MKNFKILTHLLAFAFLVSCTQTATSQDVSNMALDEFVKTYKSTENAQLLDLRTPGEWANGVLNTSEKINFNGADFATEIEKLDKEKPLFIYCASGGRSGRASSILKQAGFNVYNLKGAGYAQLAEEGL